MQEMQVICNGFAQKRQKISSSFCCNGVLVLSCHSLSHWKLSMALPVVALSGLCFGPALVQSNKHSPAPLSEPLGLCRGSLKVVRAPPGLWNQQVTWLGRTIPILFAFSPKREESGLEKVRELGLFSLERRSFVVTSLWPRSAWRSPQGRWREILGKGWSEGIQGMV